MFHLKHLLFFFLLQYVNANLFRLTISEGDRQVIHVKSFGFDGEGRSNCTLVIKDFHYLVKGEGFEYVESTQTPLNPIGFAFEGRDTANSARLEENVRYPDGQCFAYWQRKDRLSVSWPSVHKVIDHVVDIEISNSSFPQVIDFSKYITPGLLSLFFYDCNENTRYSFSIEVHQYNLNTDGTKNYLSEGQSVLPLLYGIFGISYLMCFYGWTYLMIRHRARVHKIHYLMALLVFLKFLSLFLESGHLYVIGKYGHGRLYADVPYYTTLTLKGMLLFFVILLVGTGWSFIKPFMTENEKKILLIVAPLVIIDSIAIVIEDTVSEGHAAWSTWRDIRRILDVIACCAVLLPVVWSIRNLREATSADGKAARSLVRLRQFRAFYALLVAYIYYTRIVVPLIRSALHWRVIWVAPFIEELGTFIFYFCTGWKFRPQEENIYASLQTEDFDDISLRAELEAHDLEQQAAQTNHGAATTPKKGPETQPPKPKEPKPDKVSAE
jgi:hypothetical protein